MTVAKKKSKGAKRQAKRASIKTKLRKKEAPQSVESPQELKTTMIEGTDRMLRYNRNPKCPECGAHPVICTIRRRSYKAFRCRMCGYRWEVNY